MNTPVRPIPALEKAHSYLFKHVHLTGRVNYRIIGSIQENDYIFLNHVEN